MCIPVCHDIVMLVLACSSSKIIYNIHKKQWNTTSIPFWKVCYSRKTILFMAFLHILYIMEVARSWDNTNTHHAPVWKVCCTVIKKTQHSMSKTTYSAWLVWEEYTTFGTVKCITWVVITLLTVLLKAVNEVRKVSSK